MIRARPSDVAWLVLVAGVITYDVTARDGETLSEAIDHYLEHHPWLTRAAILITACHLINAYPAWADPWTWAFIANKRLRRR